MNLRILLFVLLVTFFINAFSTVFFLLPAALQQQSMSLSLIGWLMSIASVGSLVSRPAGTFITEKLGLKRGLLLTCLCLLVVSLPLIGARTFAPLLFIRFMIGFVSGMVVVVIMAYQAFLIPIEQRGGIYAWIGVAYVLPQLIVIPPAEALLSCGRFDLYMGTPSLLALLGFSFALFLPEVASSAAMRDTASTVFKPVSWGQWKDIRSAAGFWPLVFITLVFSILNATTLLYVPAFIKGKGLIASAFIAANGGTALFWRVFAYRVMNRIDRRRVIGLIVAGMGTALFLLRWADSNIAFMTGGFLYGSFMGIGFPIILALVPDVFPSHLIPKGVTASVLAMDAGFFLAPVLAGYLGQGINLESVFSMIGISGLLCGVLVYVQNRNRG